MGEVSGGEEEEEEEEEEKLRDFHGCCERERERGMAIGVSRYLMGRGGSLQLERRTFPMGNMRAKF